MNSSSPVICELGVVVANRWGIVRSAITISAIILMEEEKGEDRNGAREIGTKCRRGGSNEQLAQGSQTSAPETRVSSHPI